MNKTYTVKGTVVAAALGLCLAAASAGATTIYELGTVDPGSPASPSDETGYLNELILGYNAGKTGTLSATFTGDASHTYTLAPGSFVPSPLLPVNPVNTGQNMGGGGVQTGLVINLGTGGFDYASVKWGDTDEFYYIAGLTGNITLNNEVNGNGESHFDLFTATPVASAPDSGTTIEFLGMALLGMGLIRRKFGKL